MVEDVTQEYYDLVENRKELEEELKGGNFFQMEEGVTYKVKLTSTKVTKINKKFEHEDGSIDDVIKYGLNITAKGSDKSEFEGVWEVGKTILAQVFKLYETDVVFNCSKTGKGLKTRYSVNKDF